MPFSGLITPTPAALVTRIENIRQLMLNELGEYGEKKFPATARRIRFAPDILGLWYARSDLMAVLSNACGETAAREKIARISDKFKGLLPKSVTSTAGLRPR